MLEHVLILSAYLFFIGIYGLITSGPWSSIFGLLADKIFEIDQSAGLVWLFLSIEKESAVCASHLLLGSLDDTA